MKARGFYVSGGNNSGKGKKGKSGKPSSFKPKGGKGAKGGGKARGMSLDELKAVTACADCEQIGHWKGDPECPKQKRGAHEAARDDGGEEEWYGEDEEYQWYDTYWEEQYDGQARSAHTAYRIHRLRPLQRLLYRPRPLHAARQHHHCRALRHGRVLRL